MRRHTSSLISPRVRNLSMALRSGYRQLNAGVRLDGCQDLADAGSADHYAAMTISFQAHDRSASICLRAGAGLR